MMFMNGLYFALRSGNEHWNVLFTMPDRGSRQWRRTALPVVHRRPLKKPPRWPERELNQTKGGSSLCKHWKSKEVFCDTAIPPCAHQKHQRMHLLAAAEEPHSALLVLSRATRTQQAGRHCFQTLQIGWNKRVLNKPFIMGHTCMPHASTHQALMNSS